MPPTGLNVTGRGVPSQVFQELDSESDRGAFLIGVSYLDELLQQCIEAKLANHALAKRAAGNLAHRANLCLCMGMLTPEELLDLDALRAIRNKFAHVAQPVSFSDETVATACHALRTWQRYHTAFPNSIGQLADNPKVASIYTVACIASRLRRRSADATHQPILDEPTILDTNSFLPFTG